MNTVSPTLVMLLTLCTFNIQAAVHHVNTTEDLTDVLPGDGLCQTSSGLCSLRAAITESNASKDTDTVQIPAGHFTLTLSGNNEDHNSTGDLDIISPVNIHGSGLNLTTINGNQLDRVFDVMSSGVVITGLTITGGIDWSLGASLPTARGSAIFNRPGSSLTLEQIQITGNHPRMGAFGFGASIVQRGTLLANQIIMSDNPRSSAIWIDGATTAIHQCLIEKHTVDPIMLAGLDGFSKLDSLIFSQCSITDNHVDTSTGILFVGSHVSEIHFINTTISGNTAQNELIANDNGSQLFFHHTSIYGNQLQSSGHTNTIVDFHGSAFPATHFLNSIISNNGPVNKQLFGGGHQSHGGNYFGNLSDGNNPPSIELTPTDISDPKEPSILSPLVHHNAFSRYLKPMANSPVLGIATPENCIMTDQIGRQRFIANCDSGSIQYFPDLIFFSNFEAKRQSLIGPFAIFHGLD